MTSKTTNGARDPSEARKALVTWRAEVRKAEADLHRVIKRRHSADYFETIRAHVDRLEDIDSRLREPSTSRTELDVPLWDRMLVMWAQYGEPLAMVIFVVIFVVGVIVGAVL